MMKNDAFLHDRETMRRVRVAYPYGHARTLCHTFHQLGTFKNHLGEPK